MPVIFCAHGHGVFRRGHGELGGGDLLEPEGLIAAEDNPDEEFTVSPDFQRQGRASRNYSLPGWVTQAERRTPVKCLKGAREQRACMPGATSPSQDRKIFWQILPKATLLMTIKLWITKLLTRWRTSALTSGTKPDHRLDDGGKTGDTAHRCNAGLNGMRRPLRSSASSSRRVPGGRGVGHVAALRTWDGQHTRYSGRPATAPAFYKNSYLDHYYGSPAGAETSAFETKV